MAGLKPGAEPYRLTAALINLGQSAVRSPGVVIEGGKSVAV